MAVGGGGGGSNSLQVWAAVLGCAAVAVVVVAVVPINECGMLLYSCCPGLTTCQNPRSSSPAGLGYFKR